jgi:hypothetical protein
MEHIFGIASFSTLQLVLLGMSPIAVILLLANFAYWCHYHHKVLHKAENALQKGAPDLNSQILHDVAVRFTHMPAYYEKLPLWIRHSPLRVMQGYAQRRPSKAFIFAAIAYHAIPVLSLGLVIWYAFTGLLQITLKPRTRQPSFA